MVWPRLFHSLSFSRFHRQVKDITQYYQAPVTRFLYNTVRTRVRGNTALLGILRHLSVHVQQHDPPNTEYIIQRARGANLHHGVLIIP